MAAEETPTTAEDQPATPHTGVKERVEPNSAQSEAGATPPVEGTALEPLPSAEQKPARQARRWLRGSVALAGGFVLFCLMASELRWRGSVPVGTLAAMITAWGLFDVLGAFEPREEVVASRVSAAALWPRLAELAIAVVVHLGVLTLLVAGVVMKPILFGALAAPATFLWVVSGVYRIGVALGCWDDRERPLRHRHGFWLVVLTTLLYLPLLGSYSLSDPWETHYGEVAREMLARDDWLSTWWAQDGWFWSKPIFDFWIQGLSFSLLGVRYMPGEMVAAVAAGRFPQPEWAARMPVFILTLLAVYALYKAVARVFGRRAGLLAGLVLTTMPYWFLIAHQTMTDMPYVAPLTVGLSLVLLGMNTDPEERVRTYEITVRSRRLHVSAFHLVFFGVLLCALPQILYLATRNVTLHLSNDVFGFRFHPEEIFLGSGAGNCGLPGNQECRSTPPVNPGFWPVHGAAVWSLALGFLLWTKRDERRLQRVYFLGGWLFVALSALAKGAPGLVLPLFTVLAFLGATRRWKELERLELPSLALLVACVTLPWYVQMYARHGYPFFDRLIMHDMYKRAFTHVHDTNQGDDVSFRYYVWQLGYGLFPWTGLSAAGLLWWLRRPDRTRDGAGQASVFMMLWFLGAFGMFTITLTKFHHYVLPLVPPTAALAAVVIDRAFGDESSPAASGRLARYLLGISVGVTLTVYGIMRFFPRQLDGDAWQGDPPKVAWAILCAVAGVALAVTALVLYRRRAPSEASEGRGGTERPLAAEGRAGDGSEPAERRYEAWMLGFVGLASAVTVALAGRDMFFTRKGDIEGQMRLMHLFTYNYRRPWPASLDYTGPLLAFTVVVVALSLLWLVHRLRPHATALFCAAAVLWTAWAVNIYLYKCAPHWGQRETMMAYYRHRNSPQEPVVAYQMNWKGENFYAGNKIPAFVSSGQKFKDWVEEQKNAGVRVMFFTTEHGRIGSLKREIGEHKRFEKLTDEAVNNKFFMARVEF